MMARIDVFNPHEPDRVAIYSEVEARFFVFDMNGQQYLQIDTMGSPGREFPTKVSQSIQLGQKGREALLKILIDLSKP
jgi:hypothetical protein